MVKINFIYINKNTSSLILLFIYLLLYKYDCLFINGSAFLYFDHVMQIVFLTDGEKPVYVAYVKNYVFDITTYGRTFKADVKPHDVIFIEVEELKRILINQIYGRSSLCFAVSVANKVFAIVESYTEGYHGLVKNTSEIKNEFIKVKSLNQYKIIAAYAGAWHSRSFNAIEGKCC